MGNLRPVTPGESPRQSMSVSQAADDGSRGEIVDVADSDRSERGESGTLARDLAALSKRLMDIVDELDAGR
jgi:hypothetical protein